MVDHIHRPSLMGERMTASNFKYCTRGLLGIEVTNSGAGCIKYPTFRFLKTTLLPRGIEMEKN